MSVLSITALKNKINELINANGVQAITGPILNGTLIDLVDSVVIAGIETLQGSSAPSNSVGSEGWLYFQTGIGIYRFTSGSWYLVFAISFSGSFIKIPGMTASTSIAIPANTMINSININPMSGGPIILRIGTTSGGQEILTDTLVNIDLPIQALEYFNSSGYLYFGFTSGTGSLNIRIDLIYNFN